MRKKLVKASSLILLVLVISGIVAGKMSTPKNNMPEEKKEEISLQTKTPADESKTITKETEKDNPDKEQPKSDAILQTEKDEDLTCSLIVRCDAVIEKMDKLDEDKKKLIPSNGVIFSAAGINFSEKETVFDVLERELKKQNIHLDAAVSPLYRSVYVKGIGNLYEFDCGDSGWIYSVNGESPMHGCSQHEVDDKDKIEFIYVCR